MDGTLMYLAAFVGLVAVAVATSILVVKRNGHGAGDLIKQLILWAGISTLMPLLSYSGATIVHPRTQMQEYMQQRNRSQQTSGSSQDQAAREREFDEQQRLAKLVEEETRLFKRAMFWVGLPVGVAALTVGLLLRAVAVGIGLATGGLGTLTARCYSYWDGMGDYLRFFSLLGVLVLLVAIGLGKYGRTRSTFPVAAV